MFLRIVEGVLPPRTDWANATVGLVFVDPRVDRRLVMVRARIEVDVFHDYSR